MIFKNILIIEFIFENYVIREPNLIGIHRDAILFPVK